MVDHSKLSKMRGRLSVGPQYHKLRGSGNTAVTMISKVKWEMENLTPCRSETPKIPVEWRIKFKIATLTFKVLETGLPPYLSQQLCPYVPTRGLRSSTSKPLQVPRTSDLVHALFVCLHPPYGTHFPTAFVPANL